jgi:hypothetical protein
MLTGSWRTFVGRRRPHTFVCWLREAQKILLKSYIFQDFGEKNKILFLPNQKVHREHCMQCMQRTYWYCAVYSMQFCLDIICTDCENVWTGILAKRTILLKETAILYFNLWWPFLILQPQHVSYRQHFIDTIHIRVRLLLIEIKWFRIITQMDHLHNFFIHIPITNQFIW